MSEAPETPTATFIRALNGFRGVARLYRCEGGQLPEFVIVSAADVPFSGPETYVFAATPSGEIVNFVDLVGSFRGAMDHDRALNGAGYVIRYKTYE